jgi:hypothetical protein
MKSNRIALFAAALKIGTLKLKFKRTRSGWAAFVPSKQTPSGDIDTLSEVKLCDFGTSFHQGTLKRLRFNVASRYLAQVFEDSDCCHINLRWAMKLPNWGRFGALPELAHAMKRAGLI